MFLPARQHQTRAPNSLGMLDEPTLWGDTWFCLWKERESLPWSEGFLSHAQMDISPNRGAQLVGTFSCTQKSRGFVPQLQHIPRLGVWSQAELYTGGYRPMFHIMFFSLHSHLPLSLKCINISLEEDFFKDFKKIYPSLWDSVMREIQGPG